jgi:hypothetical protein
MGLDPPKALIERDEARKMKNRVGIQVVELNPISLEKAAKKRMGRNNNPRRMKAMNITRKPGGGRGMISGPAARVSAGS